MNKIERAIKKAENKYIEAENAARKVEEYLVFIGFDEEDMPKASVCTGCEFILEWHGNEIYPQQIIEAMETQGCITPQDFDYTIDDFLTACDND